MWTEKYRPKNFEGFRGNRKVIEDLRGYEWKKPLLIYGPPGVGKSVLTHIIAEEYNLDLVEITEGNIGDAAAISKTSSLLGKKKLIYIDNVDKIRNIKAVTDLLKSVNNPLILVTSDYSSKRLSTIKRRCNKVNIRKPRAASITKLLGDICTREGVKIEKTQVSRIAENSGGDIRSAIIDLETICKGREEVDDADLIVLESRDRSTDIYNALSTILIKKDFTEAIKSTWNLNLQPRDTLLWIDENIPRVYSDKEDLRRAYHYLSRADVFIGRIMERQYWGFLRYASPLMTGGVNVSKKGGVKPSFFQFPGYIIKMSQTKKERGIKKSIGKKLAPELHASIKIIVEHYLPLYKILLKAGAVTGEELEGHYGLDREEISYLM